MKRLSKTEIAALAPDLPAWECDGKLLRRTYEFPDFGRAIKFVDKVAWAAEKVEHHPDIDVRWNRVTLVLTTHDAGGLTGADFGLAGKCDRLAGQILKARV
jgi:4a-hydroxytetrahydrobiopterin dehydratase